MLRAVIAVVAAFGAQPAASQDAPSFDCSKASTSAEEMVCADPELAELDRRVAKRFAEAIAAAQSLDVGAAEAEADLRAYQRGWIGGRDECWKADDQRACVAFSYLSREAELVARWMLEEPTRTAFWTCGGNPANEVVTTFYDTPLPSVRIERGDSVDVGMTSPTGSGARYDGNFGRWIWIKGNEAIYRDPDPDGSEYTCELRKEE